MAHLSVISVLKAVMLYITISYKYNKYNFIQVKLTYYYNSTLFSVLIRPWLNSCFVKSRSVKNLSIWH